MRIMVLDGSEEEDLDTQAFAKMVKEELSKVGLPFDFIELRHDEVSACKACYDCWVKTPGICCIADRGNDIGRLWVMADLVVLVSKIVHGARGSLMTQALERQIGLVLPYFTTEEGIVHHGARYGHYPSILSIGVCDELCQCDNETFKRLGHQEGRALGAFHTRTLVLCTAENTETARLIINSSLMEMKVR